MRVYAIIDIRSREFPLGDAVELCLSHEDAERFVEQVRDDDPELAGHLRIVEFEFEAGARG